MPQHVFYVKQSHVVDNSLEHIDLPDEITKVVCLELTVTSFPSKWGEHLTDFSCLDCVYVTELPESYTKLIRLNCAGCINLRFIPLYPLLEILNCVGCVNLTELPPFFNIKQLYCQRCVSLTDLPKFLFLRRIDYSGCNNLPKQLPKWPNLVI